MMEMPVSMRVIVFSNEQCIYLQLFVLSIKNTKAASRTCTPRFPLPSPCTTPLCCMGGCALSILGSSTALQAPGKTLQLKWTAVHCPGTSIVSAGNGLLIAVRKVLATARWIMSNKLSTRGQGGPASSLPLPLPLPLPLTLTHFPGFILTTFNFHSVSCYMRTVIEWVILMRCKPLWGTSKSNYDSFDWSDYVRIIYIHFIVHVYALAEGIFLRGYIPFRRPFIVNICSVVNQNTTKFALLSG